MDIKKDKEIPPEILLNMMYTGSYLNNGNIGHEIINLFESNNGKNYIYVLPYGTIGKKHNIETILLVRRCKNNTIEILAKATGLHQISISHHEDEGNQKKIEETIEIENITYGGVRIDEIFKKNSKTSKIYVTFEAVNVQKVKESSIISGKNLIKGSDLFQGENSKGDFKFSRQSPKQYISSTGGENDSETPYGKLKNIIDNKIEWEEEDTTKIIINEKPKEAKNPPSREIYLEDFKPRKPNFLEIIQKEYDELSYSNMLAYFFNKYPYLFVDFMKKQKPEIKTSETFTIEREKYNIDLLFECEDSENKEEKTVIVIENKIRSGINGIKKEDEGYSQLQKYVDIIEGKEEYHGQKVEYYKKFNKFFFLLTPNYNNVDKKLEKFNNLERWQQIKYKDLYDFFDKKIKENYELENDKYFKEFVSTLEIHTRSTDNKREDEMYSRFAEMIKESLKQNK